MPLFNYHNVKAGLMMLGLTIITLPYQNCGSALQTGSQFETMDNSSVGLGTPDTQAPSISILAPMPSSYVKGQALLAGTCEDGFPVTYYIDAPKNSSTALCNTGAFSVPIPSNLTDGNHIAWVSQTDLAGNKATKSIEFMIDNTAPVVKINSPANNSSSYTSSSVTFSGICEDGLTVSLQGAALAAPVSGPCISSNFQIPAVLASSAGAKTVSASQVDAAGNSSSNSISLNLSVPTIPIPVVKITAPAANFLTKNKTVTVQGTCEAGLNVAISGSGVSTTSQTTCASGTFSVSIQFSANDGLKNIIVAQTNSQNGTGQDSRSFQLDATAPIVTIQSPAANTQAVTGLSLGGNCETGLEVSITGTGLAAVKKVSCASGMFQSNIDFSAGTGVKAITVSQTDAAGNTGTNSRNFERIAPPPPNGPLLYANNCAGCHQPLASSAKLNRTSAQIKNAIATIPTMNWIVLTDPEIQAISDALKTTTPSLTLAALNIPTAETGTFTYRVTLSAASATNVTFNYATSNGSATSGSDYAAISGSNTIPAGQTSKDFSVSIVADSVDEADETFNFAISNVVGANVVGAASIMSTIKDDDGTVVPLTKFDAFKASIAKNCNTCHGNSGSPYPGIANFAHLQTENDWLTHSPKLIAPGNLSGSPVYTRTRFAGTGTTNNMPFVIPGIPDNMTTADAKAISDYITSLQVVPPPVGGTSPQSGYSALAKVKILLHGEAPTSAEISQAVSSGQLLIPQTKSLIDSWMSSQAGQEKLKEFFRMSLQQDNISLQPNELFGSFGGQASKQLPIFLQTLTESMPRTAMDIINNNRPFNEIVTTRRIAVTTALLVGLSYADNATGNAYGGSPTENGAQLYNFLVRGTNPAPLSAADFEDWRFVNITQAPNNSSGMLWSNFSAIRSTPNGANYPLFLPRVGFFNSLAFQMKWLTNEDNQFRVTTNQTLIAALNTTFAAGDPTPHGTLAALDPVHAPTTSSCFQCHRLMDPMRDVFRYNYGYAYRANVGVNIGSKASGPVKGPYFSFWGVQSQLNSMDHFAQTIANHPLFADSWTQKLCTFANSGPCDTSSTEFKRVSQVFRTSNYNFKTLVKEVMTSSLVVGPIQGINGAAPFISVTRSNHLCHALKKRYLQYASTRGFSYNPPSLCEASAISQTAMTALPEDGTARGAVHLVQSPVITAFSYRGMEVVCEEAAKIVVAAGRGFASTTASEVTQSLTDLVTYIMGEPSNHPRHSLSVNKIKAVYDNAKSLALTNEGAMREAFTFACVSPAVSGVGL